MTRTRRIVTLATVAALGCLVVTPSQAAQRDPLDSALRGLVAQGFPAAVAHYRDNGRERSYAAGVSDVATGQPARTAHRFRIASNTKAFTAAVVLQLVGEGRLSLDDTVAELLPGVLDGHGYRPGRITVRALLRHTSGVHDPATTADFFAPYLRSGDRAHVIPPAEVLRRAVRHGPDFAPGKRVGYSNTNYLLAGLIVERVTGHRFETELATRILEPLGLRDTTLPRLDPDVRGPHLHGYARDGEDMTVFSPSYDWTAGAMISTVNDLATFQRALFDGSLLAPEQRRELTTVRWANESQGYGAGVESLRIPCPGGARQVWGNTGAGPGYNSYSLTSDDGSRRLTFVVTSYDLAAELHGEKPWPVSPMAPVTAAFCH